MSDHQQIVTKTVTPDPLESNRLPLKLLTVGLLLTGLVLAWLVWSDYDRYRDGARFREETLRVSELRGTIIHLDEVLTDSARMAAITGDPQWEERYLSSEPQLDQAIKEVMRLGQSLPGSEAIAETDAANIKLVDLEHRSLALVREGRPGDAGTILFSEEYATQKRIYADGVTKHFAALDTQLAATQRWNRNVTILSLVGDLTVMAIVSVFWLAVMRNMQRSRARILESLTEEMQAKERLRKSLKDLSDIKFALDQSSIVGGNRSNRANYIRQRQLLPHLEIFSRRTDRARPPHHQFRPPFQRVHPRSLEHDRHGKSLDRRSLQSGKGWRHLLDEHNDRAFPERGRKTIPVHRNPFRHYRQENCRRGVA